MMRRRAGLVFLAMTACAALASAQPTRRPTPFRPQPSSSAAPAASEPTNLRARVGTELAARLLASTDPDERIRGLSRLASIGTPEAVAALVRATETGATVRTDSRALLVAARALARFTDNDRARAALMSIVNVGNPAGLVGRMPIAASGSGAARRGDALLLEEGDPVARAELAREIAAIALAHSGVERATEQLYGAARGGGSGQTAAIIALELSPPREPGFFGTAGTTMPAAVVRMLGQLGDLRALEVLHGAARSTDVAVRGSAIVSLAELGDERAVGLARTAIAEADARLRAAAGDAFVLLGAPERFKAVAALLADDATAEIGVRLAERVSNAEITKLLVGRAEGSPDRELRAAAIRALGRSPDPDAAKALVSPKLLGDPGLQYDAAMALARSPAPNATGLTAAIAAGNLKSLGLRAYVVRALLRGERTDQGDAAIAAMLASKDPRSRALAIFARVALGDSSAEDWLADKEPRIRRAAAMAALAHPSRRVERALLERLHVEPDEITREVLAAGLLGGDAAGQITTTALVDRAESGGADAPLAAYALARRADEGPNGAARKVSQLLASKDPILRAHTARGLGAAPLAYASGLLADAYAYETEVEVRRAIVDALASRTKDAAAPSRKDTLATAADLDPDGPTRQGARRALNLESGSTPFGRPLSRDVAWLRVTLDNGTAPGEPYVAKLVRADGVAVPIVFDEEGYAVVPGLPPGQDRLVLAPRLPTYKASQP